MISVTRFETQLRIACYRSITEQLIQQNLVSKEDVARIMKKIKAMERSLIMPKPEEKHAVHERELTIADSSLAP